MKKRNLYLNFLTYFYDITGDLDEYSLNELYRFGNNLYICQSLMILVSFILALFGFHFLLFPIIFLTALIQDTLQERFIKKHGLHKLEVEKPELPKAQKRMFKRTIIQTLLCTIIAILAVFIVWNSRDSQDVITSNEFFYQFSPIVLAIMIPALFIIFYIRNRRRIVVVE